MTMQMTQVGQGSEVAVRTKDTADEKWIMATVKEAMNRGHPGQVEALLPLVTPLDGGGSCGRFLDTLMARAVDSGWSRVVRNLAKDMDPEGSWGGKPYLLRAILNNRHDVIQALADHGVDVTAQVSNGKSPLHVAATVSCPEATIATLIGQGCSIDATDNIQGATSLHVACSYCNREAVFAFFSRGAEFNAVDQRGETPLAKLIGCVKKAEDFHDKSRLALARELIALGFMIAEIKSPLPARTVTYHQSRSRRHNLRTLRHRKEKTTTINSSSSNINSSCVNTNRVSNFNRGNGVHIIQESSDRGRKDEEQAYTSSQCTNHCDSNKNHHHNHRNHQSINNNHKSCNIHSSLNMNEDNLHLKNDHTLFLSTNHDSVNTASPILITTRHNSSNSTSSDDRNNKAGDSSASQLPGPDRTGMPATPSTDRPLQFPSREEQVYSRYLALSAEVLAKMSLQQRCRMAVLRCLFHRPLKSSVTKLGLPKSLQRYLILDKHWNKSPASILG